MKAAVAGRWRTGKLLMDRGKESAWFGLLPIPRSGSAGRDTFRQPGSGRSRSKHPMHVAWQFAVAIAVCGTLVLVAGCDNPASPTSEAVDRTTTVTFVYRAATTPRADLPASTQECVRGVGHTHIHPSWRSFARIDMMAIAADRW